MDNFNNEQRYMKAKAQVAEIRKFYNGLISYVIIIGALAALNYYLNDWRYPWFLWAAFGWGIGLSFQASRVYHWNPFMNRDWEERKIREYMERETQEKGDMGRWQ